jgi:hypothetical protein
MNQPAGALPPASGRYLPDDVPIACRRSGDALLDLDFLLRQCLREE